MFNGQLVAAGSREQLMREHFRGDVIEYVIEGKPDEGDFNLIRKYNGQVIGQRCYLFPAVDHPEKILEEIQSPSITVRKPSLKDLYIKLTHVEIL
jgi:hypothetical protein